MIRYFPVAALAVVACVGAGCAAVRPVSLTPSLPAPPAYVSRFQPPSDGATGATDTREASPPDHGAPVAQASAAHAEAGEGRWWSAFADPALDAAIEEALRRNYLIRDLRNLIYENQLDPAMPQGFWWPLKVGVPATLQRVNAAAPPALGLPAYGLEFSEMDVGLTASYQLDVFGQLDATRRRFQDLVDEQRHNTEGYAQTLAEDVALLWFQILEQRALVKLIEGQVSNNQGLLSIVKARFEQHLTPRLAVLQQEQQLLNTQAQVPLAIAQLALLNSRLTLVLGRTPDPNVSLVPQDRRLPDLPPAFEVGTPADLIRKNPDVQLAQTRAVEAEHLVNENLAGWLPVIEVFGAAGAQRFDFRETFLTSSIGIRLTYPVFDGGQRLTRQRQLELTVERRNWQYELAFNTAIQRVQEGLIQESKQAENLKMLRNQLELGQRVLTEARQLFEQGLSDYLPVLTALNNVSNLERASLQAQRLLLTYRVQLYHALGGTWSQAATKRVD